MNKIFILFFILIANTFFAQDKTPFTLKVKIKGLSNTHMFLANHFGSSKYKVDSIPIDKNGFASYIDKENKVKGGIYLLVFPTKNSQYVEFLISGKEKNIEIELDTLNFNDVKFKNSEENTIFFNEIKFLEPFQREMQSLNESYTNAKDATIKEDFKNKIIAKEKELLAKRLNIINTKPNLFYSKLLNLMRDIDVPDAPKKADGTIDSNFKYYYFKDHYFDYTDFNDDRILLTPIFENKFNYYFDKLILKHPDTIKKEVDYVLNKIKNPNSDMMKFCLPTLLNNYANSKIMGQDALYVHIVKNWYEKGKAPWTDSANLKKMIYDASDLEPLLIGKTAPNFAAFDTSLSNYAKLYEMKSKYKILAFWNPDCGHCKKEIPVLDSLYPAILKAGADIFAVATISSAGDNIKMWKDFIVSNKLRFKNYADPNHQMSPLFMILYKIKGTPEYYILDKNNKIIAKKLAPEQMVEFIESYDKAYEKK